MEGAQADEVAPKHKTSLLYHSETLQSFFRRLTFSPDGSLLLAPLGIFKQDEDSPVAGSPGTPGTIRASDFSGQLGSSVEETNTVYVYTRKGFGQAPVCHISGLKKPAIAISFSPVLYELTAKEKASPSPFKLPHKMIFAIATQDSIIIYDTAKMAPLGYASNLHYSTITDLVWDIDGRSLMVSSTDGFCSAIVFKESSFGKKIVDKVTVDAEKMEANEENKDKEEETRGDAKIESELQTKISSKTDELLEVRKISEGISEGINSAVDKIVANAITPVIPPPIAPIRLDPIMLASADSVSKFVAEPTNDISKFMAAPITPTTTNVASEPCTSIPTSDIESTHTETKDLATVVPAAKKRRIQPILIE